jgi:phosphoribosylformylglycinamidine synthase
MNDTTIEIIVIQNITQRNSVFRASLQEAVACKDWLTNKVDRCVGGKVAKQQCAGPLQLPLNNVGVMALDLKRRNCHIHWPRSYFVFN